MCKFCFTPLSFFILFLHNNSSFSQCTTIPIPLTQRVTQAAYIVQGRVVEQHGYKDAITGSINTLNKIKINAWLKNYQDREEIFLITPGGVLENRATRVFPSFEVAVDNEYIFFLEKEDKKAGDNNFRNQYPGQLQLLCYADAQGAILYRKDGYYDLFSEKPVTGTALFQSIANICGQQALTVSGKLYKPEMESIDPIVQSSCPIVFGSYPAITNAGTISPGDFLFIYGSCMTGCSVSYTGTNTQGYAAYNLISSDYIYQTDDSILVKVPENAGTGIAHVCAGLNSSLGVICNYSLLGINSSYSGFSQPIRQRYYLRNMNGLGGYTFLYNNNFNSNTAAAYAFSRAISTWRCATGVNIRANGTTPISTAAADGVSVVMFDNTLPVGLFARTTTQLIAGATVTCSLDSTVWYLSEVDFQFNDPPKPGFTWQYGPALPSSSQYDFESIGLHELGHSIGLGHREALGEVMHYTIAAGASSRAPFPHEIEGEVIKLNYSIVPTCFNPAGSGTPMMLANCLLPVSMGALTGIRLDKKVNQLNWNTYQEINNHGFSIQRSASGQNFTTIGFVPGAINSSTERNYEYRDLLAGEPPWFYRLQITSLDGQIKISSTVYVPGFKNNDWKIWITDQEKGISIFRNLGITDQGTFQLYSSSGQLVLVKKINTTSTNLPVNNFAKGIYYYRLISNTTIVTGKLILEY